MSETHKPDFKQMTNVVINSIGYQEDPETAIKEGFESLWNEFYKQIDDLKKRLEVLESATSEPEFIGDC